MASSMAKEARDALTRDDRICSDRRSRKDKCGGSKESGVETEDGTTKKEPLYNRDRLRKELLYL